MLKWRIYYGDGTTFSSEDGGPELAPARNVQLIVQGDSEHGWYMQHGTPYYIWRPEQDRWVGVNEDGKFDYLIDPGWKRVLYGRTLTTPEFLALYQLADRDPGFPHKTAFRRGERNPRDKSDG